MTTQDPTRESPFTPSTDTPYEEDSTQGDRRTTDVDRDDADSWDEPVDVAEEVEFEEIPLPGSLREGFAQVAEALRGIVRAQPLAVLAAAAGAAYIAGRIASRR